MPSVNPFYRCAGPNCGQVKNSTDRWWLVWSSFGEYDRPIFSLCRWDEEIARREGALPACGEQCVQRLQSQFIGNLMRGELRRSGT